MNRARRMVYIGLGTLFLLLGAIGIFVPLLPTTPFWLLTCWFYIRSSRRLYVRVMRHPYFGPYIGNFVMNKGVPVRAKVMSLGIMWTSAILTSVFVIERWWVAAALFLITTAVSWHILSYPTKKSK